jgi:hypothetical protein
LITATSGLVKGIDDLVDVIFRRAPEISQLAKENFDLHRLTRPGDEAGAEVRRQLARFHHEIDAPNIILVEVNSVTIRRRDGEEGGRQPVVTS